MHCVLSSTPLVWPFVPFCATPLAMTHQHNEMSIEYERDLRIDPSRDFFFKDFLVGRTNSSRRWLSLSCESKLRAKSRVFASEGNLAALPLRIRSTKDDNSMMR